MSKTTMEKLTEIIGHGLFFNMTDFTSVWSVPLLHGTDVLAKS